ncbi:winged helix-turn-helix domain-containing protein [Sphingomonas sp. ac-8]|uniref:winged helix-turn-helix domain-containing protein n=1 Tax=Sphingomonas sp. ac-8 TaxID=3242977 RepID=UPI003A808A2A
MAIDGPLKLNVQVLRGREPAIGPGKAMVLEAIDRTGSISAAGRDLGMSYRRVWLLVRALNADWKTKVVQTQVGGPTGTKLTEFGRSLLTHYRELEQTMLAAAQGMTLEWLTGELQPPS